MTTSTITKPASEKQLAFINKLFSERMHWPLVVTALETVDLQAMDTRMASSLIDYLLTFDRKRPERVHTDGDAIGEGYYWIEGLIYKVQAAKSTGNLYAKVFSETGYEYAPGAMRLMTTATRLTLEQASEAGVRTGICVICGKGLTDPDSVARGIGPVCSARI